VANATGNFNMMTNKILNAGAITGTTINTGQGAYEVYAMNQNLQSTDNPTFANLTLTNLKTDKAKYTKLFSGTTKLTQANSTGLFNKVPVDMASKNFTSVQCVRFANGAKLCGI
jgi:hypothetical protein